MSTKLSDAEVRLAVSLISPERFATFVRIAGTERDALDLYQRSVSMAGAMMPVIGMMEVALRNAVCDRLRLLFDRPDWLRDPPLPFQWKGSEKSAIGNALLQAQRAAYARKGSIAKHALDAAAGVPPGTTHLRRSKARQRAIVVTNGDHIAQLTLFFWKRLFSADYEARLWKPALRALFPDKTVGRAAVAVHIEAIYVARNRLAHHEPLLGERLDAALGGIAFVTERFALPGEGGRGILRQLLSPHLDRLDAEVLALTALMSRFAVPAAGKD